MPDQRQITMIDSIPTTTTDKGQSDTARLKSAYGHHEKSVVVAQAQVSDFDIGEGEQTTVEFPLSRDEMRENYKEYVMSGEKSIPGSYFPESAAADLDYNGAPSLGATGPTPVGEATPGDIGSTIVASGLGPNVNVHGDLASRSVVDGSTSPSSAVIDPHHTEDGKQSPKTTSTLIAAEKLIPPGSMGHSTSTSTEA